LPDSIEQTLEREVAKFLEITFPCRSTSYLLMMQMQRQEKTPRVLTVADDFRM
jgi:hypothetical protein